MPSTRATASRPGLLVPLLFALVLAAYLPVLGAGFVWDDDAYVTENPLLRDGDGLMKIWTSPRASPQYYPLVFTTFWAEHRIWGKRPFGYHAVNLLLHALNASLLWVLLRRLAVPGAWLAAAVFALHPVHVESVAWVTERKNLLSGACYLGAALAWLSFEPDEGAPPGAGRRWDRYALALLLFVGALLSKSVTATLPAALLLVRWWKAGRVRWRDAAPLLPFLLLGAAAGMHTAYLERAHVGAAGASWDVGPATRAAVAGRALWFYLGKLLWPSPLIFVYPRWEIDSARATQYAGLAAAIALVVALFLARNRLGRGPAAAALFFGGSLLPALGVLNVYPMRYSWVADHFQYLASIGPIVLGAAGASALRVPAVTPGLRRLAAATLLAALGVLTARRCGAYADAETLWRDTVAKDPGSPIANTNLGVILNARGDGAGAQLRFETALRREPTLAEAHYNLGVVFFRRGELALARERFSRAIALQPDYTDAHTNLGVVLERQGDLAGAREHYERALQAAPGAVDTLYNLGVVLDLAGAAAEARARYEQVLRLRPDYVDALYNLGVLQLGGGDVAGARQNLGRAVLLRPQSADAHYNLGVARLRGGDLEEAEQSFARALALAPELGAAREQLQLVRALRARTVAAPAPGGPGR